MNNPFRVCASGALAAIFLLSAPAMSQEKQAGGQNQQASRGEDIEMTKKWQEAMTPGAPHKALEAMTGSWEVKSTAWTGGPAAPPAVSRGTAEMKMIMGGRFLRQDLKSEMMGMPLTGFGLTGYDNFNKKYVGFWIDNSSTAMFTMEGSADAAGTVFTFYGKSDEPMTGERGKTIKYILRIVNNDTHIFEIYDLSIREPNTKVMEMTYTRKK